MNLTALSDAEREHAAEVLEQGADYLDEYGLHQGEYYPGADNDEWWRHGRPVCGYGAVRSAENGFRQWCSHEDRYVEMSVAADVLGELVHVTEFNDAPGRTAAEVAQVLRDAATKVRPDAMVVSG